VRAEERHHLVGLGVAPEHRLREDELAVDVDVEDAAVTGNDLDAADALLVLLENARRQTGGVRARPSGNAVLDPDHGPAGHVRKSSCGVKQGPR
jgi:hypothetical protein